MSTPAGPARSAGGMPAAAAGTVALQCRCGAVHGRVTDASPRSVNRAICYCDDCQAFAHHLGRADLLDAHGGSDIVQVAPASLALTQGHASIRGVRLTPTGLHRWYAGCCNTPLGNVVSTAIPFVGIVTAAFAAAGQAPDRHFGTPRGAIKGEYAIGAPPPGSRGVGVALMIRSIAKVVGWRIGGKAWPHPFFDRASGRALYPVAVLSQAQRDALRPMCGPLPRR
jgi:hypothetical protein